MEKARADAQEFLSVALDMGEELMACGAEVNRVEDTIARMGFAYGAKEMNVFVITTSIVVTMGLSESNSVTLTRRINTPGGIDFRKLARINTVSRDFCHGGMTVEQLKEEFEKATCPTTTPIRMYLGSALAAGAFAVFFGGKVWDGLVAALFGLLICFLQRELSGKLPNLLVFNLISAFLIGMGVCLTAKFIPGLNLDKILIGDIMLLIPGIAMTNAIRDILVGDTVAGTMRLVETIMWAGALAGGFMVAFWIVW
ncbi:MAG: threonine/serine exporter family protein [Clostridia bacterium]|nr:threonine/serine exporter family protein [Clostridia bacterium]MBR5976446.1 threonine/serine exporter family protein [Clostridia bacterium]MBR6478988.1 threonine/serine exporter family protein [Clostridia bacterium]MBR6512643.1 threonine/serine exporter family protein [Clostridia bacterium]